MPIVPPTVTALVQANLAGSSILGISAPMLSLGVSIGFCQYAVTGIIVNTIDAGLVGGGTGLGPGIILPSPVLIGTFQSTFTANGINGVSRSQIILALANAISQAFAIGLITTVNTGVGAGTGIASFIPNSGLSVPMMIAGFTASGIAGISSVPLATAIALGIDQAIPSAIGQVVIVGGAGLFPSTGFGLGKIN